LLPLGLTHTGVYYPAGLNNIASGYQYLDGKSIPALPWDMSRAIGAGAMYSTVEDLFRWNEALFHGKVLSPASLSVALTPVTMESNGPDGGYGYGFFLSALRGTPEVHHGGTLHGFNSFLLRLPRENLTVVVLANSLPSAPGIDSATLAHDIAEYFVGERLAPRFTNTSNSNVPVSALDAISGRYDYGPTIMTVAVERGHAFTQIDGQPRFEIFPKSETEFFWKGSDAKLTFVKDAAGNVTKAVRFQDGWRTDAPRLASLDESSIAAILGLYDFSRLGHAVLTVTRDGGRVFAQLTGQFSHEIFPRTATEFYWKGAHAEVTFVKDAAGRVTKAIQRKDGTTLEAPKIN